MIHTTNCIDAKKLARIKPTDPPGAGKNWKAVPFTDVAAAVTAGLHDRKLKPANEWFAVSPKKDVMAGVWDCQGGPKLPKGVTLQIGVIAGNDRHTPLTVYRGIEVKDPKAGPFSVVLSSVKAPGRTSTYSCTAGRIEQALALLLLDEDTKFKGFRDLVNMTTDDAVLLDFDVLEALIRGAETKLYPWSHVRSGAAVYRKIAGSRPYTRAEAVACLWACLGETNPVNHLKAGLAFRELLPL